MHIMKHVYSYLTYLYVGFTNDKSVYRQNNSTEWFVRINFTKCESQSTFSINKKRKKKKKIKIKNMYIVLSKKYDKIPT